ncbi:MAG: peroxide stress protein YaaA [Bacteroidia bacterium]
MLTILSPAKTLDFGDHDIISSYSQPAFESETKVLVEQLAKMSASKIGKLMKLSDKLAELNYERYQNFSFPFTQNNAKQAVLAFKGDVYLGLQAEEFLSEDFDFAQNHLRILSGLYGLLKPLDLMQPYRLEMGTSLKVKRKKDLYAFWGAKIAEALNASFDESGNRVLVNLASNEYFKAVDRKVLDATIITPNFKELRDGKLKIISFFAKKARGLMADFIIRNRINDPEGMKDFHTEGYAFNAEASTETEWIFSREQA